MKTKTLLAHTKNQITGLEEFVPIEGIVIGPLAVNRATHSSKRWTVTHIATGYSVQTDIPTKTKAIELARKLRALDCWGFDEAGQCKKIDAVKLKEIHRLKREFS